MEPIELIAFVALAWSVVQSLLMYRSIPREAWDKMIDGYNERAAKTESDLDDKVGAAVERFVTPLFDRFGVFQNSPPDTPVTLPPANPQPFDPPLADEPVAYVFPLAPYARREDYGNRQIHIPHNLTYEAETLKNPVNQVYPHPNVNISEDKGAEFAIDSIAGQWGFGSHAVHLADGIDYEVSVEYTAKVNSDVPLNDWLWWSLQVDGISTEQQHGISNGKQSSVWVIKGAGKQVTIAPQIRALWANGKDSSVIRWHSFTITPQKKA